jgi:hypothetical protein
MTLTAPWYAPVARARVTVSIPVGPPGRAATVR